MIKLIVFDIAGTTVRDRDEVLYCFREACIRTGILATDDRLNALMGVSKLEVFILLWQEQLEDATLEVITAKADATYLVFREILEEYYLTQPVEPTEGALDLFEWCTTNNIKIALNTGFYRFVTDIILDRLGWKIGETIDFVVTSDEVTAGRPAPYMIQAAMAHFGITDPKEVVKIGDTPVDLAEGRNAGCLLSLAVTNGTHSEAQLSGLEGDGLLASVSDLKKVLADLI
jgi:phosphonatase-like hydrolase